MDKRHSLLIFCLCYISLNAQLLPDLADVEYARVQGISLKLDIYFPKGVTPPFPVVIFIHGGGWQGGDKASPWGDFLVPEGFALVSINYRLSGQAKWPAHLLDCKGAVRWVRANSSTYNFDPTRVGVFGSSAGGHLVAMLGVTTGIDSLEGNTGGNLQYSSTPQAVCDWVGPSNFLTICDYPSSINHCTSTSPEGNLLGCAIPTCPNRARDASPLTYISGDEPPFLIMHGTEDMAVPYYQSVELDSVLRVVGNDVTFKPVVGADHPATSLPYWTSDSVNQTVIQFFNRTLGKPVSARLFQTEKNYSFNLGQNSPNPFFQETLIPFMGWQESAAPVLKIFNAEGKLVNKIMSPDRINFYWDGRNNQDHQAPAGIYLYQIDFEGRLFMKKMIKSK